MQSEAVNENSELSSGNGTAPTIHDADAVFSRLVAAIERFRGQNHLILLMGTPDPDAISSALALEFIASTFEIESIIVSFQSVSHHENRALVKSLGVELQRYSPELDLSGISAYSIVDSQRSATPIDARLNEFKSHFLAFIDHHREDATTVPDALFVDIRPGFGSTAAICCEYLKCLLPSGLCPSDPEHVRLATALMHGMRSDTSKFRTATRAEYEGAGFIAPCVDTKVIRLIERKVLSSSMLDMFEKSLVNRRCHDNFIFSDVGFVRSADRDGIPQAAEMLLAREGTDTVLVFGIVDEKTIDGSLRTSSETINPDEFLKGVLGVSPESGQFYGGGNIRDRGGFQIPLGFISLHKDKDQVYRMAREVIEKALLDYIGKATKTMS